MYTIRKTEKKIETLCDKAWDSAEVAQVDTINWKGFEYEPKMTAKLLYNDYGIYVQMETDEKPLLATFSEQNSAVCNDSCMEFFVRPNANDKYYFNFEFNAFGTMYLGYRSGREGVEHPEENKEYFNVISYVDDKSWKLQFTIPFEFIDKYFGTHTDVMYANIYKCGNAELHRHYLTYYPIYVPKPDYHRPEYFGEFVLEK